MLTWLMNSVQRPEYKVNSGCSLACVSCALSLLAAAFPVANLIQDGRLWSAAVGTAVLGSLSVVVGRGLTAGAWFTDQGVYVRNVLRTSFVPWHEVDRFVVGATRASAIIGIVERVACKPLAMSGIQGQDGARHFDDRSAEHVIEQMNRDLERRAAGSG